MENFQLQVLRRDEIPGPLRHEIIELCNRAYEEDLGDIFAAFPDSAHILGYVEGKLVSHALWVTRWLQVDSNPLLRTAYVELVATEAEYRNRGYASAVMRHLVTQIQDFDLGALSPFSVDYYRRLGWEPWRGPLFIRQGQERLASPDDEEVMIYRLPKTPPIDTTSALSAEWRIGELW